MHALSGMAVERLRDVVAGKTQRVVLPYMPVIIAAWDVGKITRSFNPPADRYFFCPPGGSIIKNDHKND